MGRNLDQIVKSLPKARRAKIEARAAELIAEETTLQDLRKAFGFTQNQMAKEAQRRSGQRVARRKTRRLAPVHVEGLRRGHGRRTQSRCRIPWSSAGALADAGTAV